MPSKPCATASGGRECGAARRRTLYVRYHDGGGRSRLTNAAIERRLAMRCTGRNWNTMLKVAALLED